MTRTHAGFYVRPQRAPDPSQYIIAHNDRSLYSGTSMVLKRERGQADAFLHVTGRDIEEREAALMFHKDTGHWSLMGDAEEFRRSKEQNDILLQLGDNGPMRPAEIAEALDKNGSTVRTLLGKMVDAGYVTKNEWGGYVAC